MAAKVAQFLLATDNHNMSRALKSRFAYALSDQRVSSVGCGEQTKQGWGRLFST
jgi:hypothetical protein